MRKSLLLFAAFLFFVQQGSSSSAISTKPPKTAPKASELMVPLFGTGVSVSLEYFSKLTPKKYQEITGRKLRLIDRFKLGLAKRAAKKLMNPDGTVNTERLQKKFGFFDRWSWHWGGFALGFLLILGPIIALFFNDDYKWDRFWSAMVTAGILISALGTLIAGGLF